MIAHGHDCYVRSAGRGGARGQSRRASRRAVFLDRDGTINAAPRTGEYIREAEDLVLLPGAAGAVKKINSSGAAAVIVTNQRWLFGTGSPESTFRSLDEQMRTLLGREGAQIDACYACPHEKGCCECRKPAPGMILRAAAELELDLRRSAVIGDSGTDIVAGVAAGVGRRLLIDAERRPAPAGVAADRVCASLPEAVEWAI